MHTFITLLFLTVSLVVTAQEKTTTLFNGKNLEGWYAFEPSKGKMERATDLFSVEDGLIRLYGPKAGYLMSEQSFDNFKLRAEYRWNTDTTVVAASKKKNSGIMYRVPNDVADELWPKGIQFQIKEEATGDFILLKEVTIMVNGQSSEAGKSVVVKKTADAERPFGEWNQIEIECNGGHVVQKLNGIVVNEASDASVLLGRILLQYEGFPIDFRNIMVEPN